MNGKGITLQTKRLLTLCIEPFNALWGYAIATDEAREGKVRLCDTHSFTQTLLRDCKRLPVTI